MSGFGRTTGRATGWPAKGGRVCGRRGSVGAGAPGFGEAAGAVATGAAGVGGGAAGSGWRGPERICPGRGAGEGGGAGRAGMGVVRSGGCKGLLPPTAASGGRSGAGFERLGSSAAAGAAPSGSGAVASIAGAGALLAGCSAKAGAGSACSGSAGGSSTATAVVAGSTCTPPPATRKRICSATLSSIELECVFFSVMPNSGSISIRVWEGISSCLASSLMRILLIVTATPMKVGV